MSLQMALCIAHFYCAHLITYNFIHYTYRLKKNYDNFMLLQNIFGYIRAKFTLKSMFSKKAYKSVARVPVSVVYLFTCIWHVLMPQFPKKIGDPRFLTDNLFL